jgi:anti-sigma regulatory factor (Ser/Thr protein kinase)
MTIEATRVQLHMDRDPRFVAAVRSAVEFQAAQAGLDAERCVQLARASEDVCRETLAQLTEKDGGLEITLHTFPDRIEISIRHRGQSVPAIGLDAFAVPNALSGGFCGVNGMELLERVDRVMFDTQAGVVSTTLVKFLQPSAQSSNRR